MHLVIDKLNIKIDKLNKTYLAFKPVWIVKQTTTDGGYVEKGRRLR